MIADELATTWTSVWLVVVSGVGMFIAVVLYTRLAGVRSFSKMSSFDFAMTVAIGSAVASVTVGSASLSDGIVGLGVIYALQMVVAVLRRRWRASRYVDNRAILLMAGSRVLDDNLTRARVTEDDVRAKLREANVLNPESVRAVIAETTGDISVLHGDDPLDLQILAGVRGVEELELDAEGGGVLP